MIFNNINTCKNINIYIYIHNYVYDIMNMIMYNNNTSIREECKHITPVITITNHSYSIF